LTSACGPAAAFSLSSAACKSEAFWLAAADAVGACEITPIWIRAWSGFTDTDAVAEACTEAGREGCAVTSAAKKKATKTVFITSR
jgi:hypothetical protein